MKPWKIVVIPTAIMLVIAGIYMFSVWKKRQNPGVVNQGTGAEADRGRCGRGADGVSVALRRSEG